jgi:hypothetical protein
MTGPVTPRLRRYVMAFATLAGLSIPMGIAAAMASGFSDSVMGSQADVTRISFGHPYRWITQDQTMFAPNRFPASVGFSSPRRSPTRLDVAALGADATLWALASLLALVTLFVVLSVIRSGLRRLRYSRVAAASGTPAT